MPGDIILHLCTTNDNQMMYGSWDIEHSRQNVLSFWAIFCPFTHPNNLPNQNFEKMEKAHGDIIILHMSTITEDHLMCDSRDIEHNRIFLIWTIFWLPSAEQPRESNF